MTEPTPLTAGREAVIRRDLEAARHPPPRYDPTVSEAIGWAWALLTALDAARWDSRDTAVDAQIVALVERLLPEEPDPLSMTSLSVERGKTKGWIVQGVVGNYDLATGKGNTLREALLALRTRAEETK